MQSLLYSVIPLMKIGGGGLEEVTSCVDVCISTCSGNENTSSSFGDKTWKRFAVINGGLVRLFVIIVWVDLGESEGSEELDLFLLLAIVFWICQLPLLLSFSGNELESDDIMLFLFLLTSLIGGTELLVFIFMPVDMFIN